MRRARGKTPAIAAAAAALVVAALVAAAASLGDAGRLVLAIEDPSADVVHAVAAARDVDVRWAERGLLVCEVAGDVPASWGARVVARLERGQELALLRAPEVAAIAREPGSRHAAFVQGAHRARLRAAAGEVWLLVAAPDSWPEALQGCHGGLVRPGHGADPRSVLDAGPPPALAPYLQRGLLDARQRDLVASVASESLRAWVDRLALDDGGRPADRWVFRSLPDGQRPDLESLYGERVLAGMRRALLGIPHPQAGARRQRFAMRRTSTQVDSTDNLVASLPGSVEGTGTFVVCAHIDATGSQSPVWRDDVANRRRVQTPGAEDNASGVACMLEMLRVVADGVRAGTLDFAFDIDFIAFSGEEVAGAEGGLVGSTRYVERAVAGGTRLLGAFNLDMVGYDRLGSNLRLVHNAASTWLADFARASMAALDPPVALSIRTELDESRASDHNSFWHVNSPALLVADASIQQLRAYSTYHQPSDTGDSVRIDQMASVTRALTAALLQMESGAHAEPRILLAPEEFSLRVGVQGAFVRYDPGFHRLSPGTPLEARFAVHNLGAAYADTLDLALEAAHAGRRRALLAESAVHNLPTGASLERVVAIPVQAGDAGTHTVELRVGARRPGGGVRVQTASVTYRVDQDFAFSLRPNPVRGAAQADIVFQASGAGDLHVDVFTLEGVRVATLTQALTPAPTGALLRRPLFPAGAAAGGTGLAPGVYLVRVRWQAAAGWSAAGTERLAILR